MRLECWHCESAYNVRLTSAPDEETMCTQDPASSEPTN